MLRNHWKKIILSVYIVAVLVISASVKAKPADGDLQLELRKISHEIQFLNERGLLNENQTTPRTSEDSIDTNLVQGLVGHFKVSETFDGTRQVYFTTTDATYKVDPSCLKDLNLQGDDSAYSISGFVLKTKSDLSANNFLPVLIVTSMKLQR